MATAPTGCTLTGFDAVCDFSAWIPPLYDANFSTSPGRVTVNTVNGDIPSNALVGLTNSGGYTGTPQITIDCGFGTGNTLTLLSDSFTSNLAWVQELIVQDCDNMVIEDGAFSALTSLTIINIVSGTFTSLSSTAFSGLSNLVTLYIYATFPTSGVPSGLFTGLTALDSLDMSRTLLYSLPSGIFNDLRNLKTLTLSECGLTTLPDGVLLPLLNITTLDIALNNFTCDCSLQWLGTYITDNGFAATTCYAPATFSGYDLSRSLALLSCPEDEENDPWKLVFRYGTATVAILALILAAIGLCYKVHANRQGDTTNTQTPKSSPKHSSTPVQEMTKSPAQRKKVSPAPFMRGHGRVDMIDEW